MYGDCTSHRARRPVLGATTLVRSFARIVFFLDQVVPGSECHQVSVVCRCWNRNGTGAPDIGVAQLIRQALELVRLEVIVVPQDVVVRRAAGALNSLVTAEIEIELGRMGDAHVHSRTGRNVARFAALFLFVCAE